MNEEKQADIEQPLVAQPTIETQLPESQNLAPQSVPSNKKKFIISILVLLVLLVSSVAIYTLLVYIPNKPENILKKAVAKFVEGGNYTLSGRLDQGDGNAPDFNYTIKTNGDDFLASIDSSTFMMGPNVEVMQLGDKKYVKFDEWMDRTELAKHYSNYTGRGTQEDLADFAGTAGVYSKQGQWMQIDDFVFDNPASDTAAPKSIEEAGMSIESIGLTENKDGKKLQNYKIKLTKDGFTKLLDQISGSTIPKSVFNNYVKANGFPEAIILDLQVDKSSKTIYRLSYNGRPFKDATLSLNLSAEANNLTKPENAPLASKLLGYGIVKTFIFNPDYQKGESASDRERIADIKGIKMAMEIYKQKHGSYPMRAAVAFDGDKLIREMSGIDGGIFIDPVGKFASMHGSQYTYIGETAQGNETCGGNYYDANTQKDFKAPECAKFWVVTMLDNGKEYKQTSY